MAYNFKNISILVVDDDRTMKILLANIFKTLKIRECFTAENGKQAFSLFMKHNPDIIVTDWSMPDIDGIQLTKMIRENNREKKCATPIMLTSGHTDTKLVKEALDIGVTEYLCKPFSINDIGKRIEYMLTNPRELIDTEAYFGPSRRRRKEKNYKGPARRKEDTDGK